MVRDEEERVPLAGVARPIRGPRFRGHAPADAGRPRRISVRTVPRPVRNRCGARARVASRRGARLGRARVQPPCCGPFGSRARDRPRSRRTCAPRSRGTEAASGDRSVHGGCNCVVRLRRDNRGGRHERATRGGARPTRTRAGRSTAGHHRRRGRALARPPSPSRMEPGAHGSWSRSLPAETAMRGVSDRRRLPGPFEVSTQRDSTASGRVVRGFDATGAGRGRECPAATRSKRRRARGADRIPGRKDRRRGRRSR